MPIENWSDHVIIAHLASDPHLGEDLESVLEQTREPGVDAVLDFAQVKYLNSSHIAKLLKLRKQISGNSSKLILCAVDTQVWSAFLVTGLDKIFEFTDAVPTALASIQIADQGSNR